MMTTVMLVLGCVAVGFSVYAQKYIPAPKPFVLGIDLGTTYSVVALYHGNSKEQPLGIVEVVADEHGRRCIPSVVAFTDDGPIVGLGAKAQAQSNPANTVYDAKRFIGQAFSASLAKETDRYQFKTVNRSDEAAFVVESKGATVEVSPTEIGSLVLKKLKASAEAALRKKETHWLWRTNPVTKAVMSVPAEFDAAQRDATMAAGKMAGLDVLRVINEPTAAAMAYGLNKKNGTLTRGLILVFDFGGGTLDVSLLGLEHGVFHTLAIAGNAHLGGEDFTQTLYRAAKAEHVRQFGAELTDPLALQRMWLAAEAAKVGLSSAESYEIVTELPADKGTARQFRWSVTRAGFEELVSPLFAKLLPPVKSVLAAAEVPADAVGDIVLVGGSTRLLKVRSILEDFFGKPLNLGIDPDEAVAVGTAMMAGIVGGRMGGIAISAIELPFKDKKIQLT